MRFTRSGGSETGCYVPDPYPQCRHDETIIHRSIQTDQKGRRYTHVEVQCQACTHVISSNDRG